MKDAITECVKGAVSMLKNWMKAIPEAYYLVTARIPRKLPETSTEFEAMKAILTKYYGLEDSADTWATVSGQITSAPVTSMRKSYKDLVNSAKRKRVNLIAQNQKLLAYGVLEGKLEQAMMELTQHERFRQAEPEVQVGTPDTQGVLPGLQDPEGGVV